MTLLTIAHLLRVLVPGITLRAVHFRHAAPNDTAEHARSFRATVQFRTACNELIVDRAALARPLPNADPGLHVLLSRYADVLLPDVGQRPLIDRVRTAIQDALDAGPIRLSAIAQRVGMSGRSLERHLNTHGYSFRGVLASERCRVAEHYLAQSDLTTAQIAQRLGYAEVAQFHRAFRSWTGSTPSERRLCARPLAAAADSASNVAGNAMAIESPRDQYRRPHGAGAATMTRESKV